MVEQPHPHKPSRAPLVTRLITVVSGLLLIPVAYLATLSGVCIRLPGAVRDLTLGLLEGYAECHRLHLEALPMLLAPLLVVHVVASLELALSPLESQGGVYRVLSLAVRLLTWALSGVLLAGIVLYYT